MPAIIIVVAHKYKFKNYPTFFSTFYKSKYTGENDKYDNHLKVKCMHCEVRLKLKSVKRNIF